METKEKFEEAKRLYETANADQRYVLESLFPELKGNEDERIRKALIKFFTLSDDNADYQCCGVHYKDIVAWLEKQKSTVDINDVCEWLQKYAKCYVNGEYNDFHHCVEYDGTIDVDSMIERLKYNFR